MKKALFCGLLLNALTWGANITSNFSSPGKNLNSSSHGFKQPCALRIELWER